MNPELILYSCDSFVIADKMHGIPTVPLKAQSPEGTLLGMVAALFPDVMDVVGRNAWEHGAVHRLDTATAGLVVFARTQEVYDHILKVQTEGLFSKTYLAVTRCDPRLKGLDVEIPAGGSVDVSSYFRSFGPGGRQVRPTLDERRSDSGVLYTTKIERLPSDKDGFDCFRCTITRGFRHQIRAHLAWIGHPIAGDPLYGDGTTSDTLELDCIQISLPLPDGKPFSFRK